MRGYFNQPYQDDATYTYPALPIPTLSANAVSSSEIDLLASISGATVVLWFFERSDFLIGPFTPLASQASSSYHNTGLSTSQTVFYRVKALLSTGYTTSYSTVVNATTSGASGTKISFVSAYLQGTTLQPISSAEALNRSRCNWCVMTDPLEGNWSTANAQTSYSLIKGFNPNCMVGWYNMIQVQPSTKPGFGQAGPVWQWTQDNLMWGYPTWHTGTPVSQGSGFWVCNETLTRLVGGESMADHKFNTVLNTMSLMNFSDFMMTDNTQPSTSTNAYDWQEDGSSPSMGSPTTVAAYISSYQDRKTKLLAKSRPQFHVANGPQGWYNDYANNSIDYRAAIGGIFDVMIYECVQGQYTNGGAVSCGGMLYAPPPGNIPSNTQVLRYPDLHVYLAGDTVPEGTPLVLKFGGWNKNFGHTTIYNPANSSKNPNCWRASLDYGDDMVTVYGTGVNIIQIKGPPPNRFNDPNGPAPAIWGNADKFVRCSCLLPIIYCGALTNGAHSHYVMQQQTPSNFGVMSDLDELRFKFGDDDPTFGGKQRFKDYGGGPGFGYQNGILVRKFLNCTTPNGTPIAKPVWMVANPPFNGTQTITFPVNMRHFGSADIDGATPQANVNNGSFIGTNLTMVEDDAYLLIEA